MEFFFDKDEINTKYSLYYRIKFNQIIMFENRDYNISEEDSNLLNFNSKEFAEHFINKSKKENKNFLDLLNNTYTKKDGNKVSVFYIMELSDSITTDKIKNILNSMLNNTINHSVIISNAKISSSNKNNFSISFPAFEIEHFLFNQISHNPTKHFIVPKHRKISENEKQKFLSENNFNLENLPKILITDPIVRYYNFKIGDILEIIRKNISDQKLLVNSYKFYRIVVKSYRQSIKSEQEEKEIEI